MKERYFKAEDITNAIFFAYKHSGGKRYQSDDSILKYARETGIAVKTKEVHAAESSEYVIPESGLQDIIDHFDFAISSEQLLEIL